MINLRKVIQIKILSKLAVLGLILSITAGCATNPVSGKKDVVLMSEAQEIQMGQEAHGQILKQYGVYDDPKLQAMLDRVGQKLAKKSHRSHLEFTFTVLDSPEINAFALPGGYVYITRGIMAYLNSEEELAGVVGHEIGHVTARHGVRQQSAQLGAGLLGVLAAVVTGDQSTAKTANYALSALVSGYGRKHELEADRLGAEYLARINYNPESMLKVIGVLKNQELFAQERAKANGEKPRTGYHGVFSSHPENDDRLKEVIRAAKKFQTNSPEIIGSKGYLGLTNNLAFGDSETQGITRKNNFYHKDLNLHLEFPKGWRLLNQPDRLVSVSPDKTQIIQFLLGDPKAKQPRQYLNKTFPKLSSEKKISRRIYSGVTELGSPWGKRNGRVAAVKHGSKVFMLMGVGQKTAPNKDFFNTVKSLGNLKAHEKKYATGKRIKLIRAKKGDTFVKLAKRSNLDQFQVSQLRLLNGLYPDGELTAGELVKIVQ